MAQLTDPSAVNCVCMLNALSSAPTRLAEMMGDGWELASFCLILSVYMITCAYFQ